MSQKYQFWGSMKHLAWFHLTVVPKSKVLDTYFKWEVLLWFLQLENIFVLQLQLTFNDQIKFYKVCYFLVIFIHCPYSNVSVHWLLGNRPVFQLLIDTIDSHIRFVLIISTHPKAIIKEPIDDWINKRVGHGQPVSSIVESNEQLHCLWTSCSKKVRV